MEFFPTSCQALSTQITIDIPDELAAEVQARGLTPENYVRGLIDKAVHTAPRPVPPAEPRMSMEEFIREMSRHSEEIPQLPEEAFTRESFYQDHD